MRRKLRVGVAALAATTVGACFAAAPASAVNDIVVSVSGAVFGSPGDVILIQEVQVAPELVGATCSARAEMTNQESVHPNTDIIVTNGASQVVFPDVESSPNKVTTVAGTVVLTETLRFDLRLGSDGVSSGGINVIFDCVATPATTVPATTVAPDTTAAPATTVAPETSVASAAQALPETGASSVPLILGAASALLGVLLLAAARIRRADV